jgi:ferredoxin-thioredoxin reductase catalytic chain
MLCTQKVPTVLVLKEVMRMDEAHITKNFQRLVRLAEKKGYLLNPNKDWVDQVIRLMTNNYDVYGKYYCPCKQHFPVDIESDVVCPCPALDSEVDEDGFCHCRLFYRKDFEKPHMDILKTISCPG